MERALKEWNASETERRRAECSVRVLEQETGPAKKHRHHTIDFLGNLNKSNRSMFATRGLRHKEQQKGLKSLGENMLLDSESKTNERHPK